MEKAISSITNSPIAGQISLKSEKDVFLQGLLSMDEIELLLEIFIERYGKRWLSVDYSASQYMELLYTKSHLMLATACLIALRHNPSLKARIYTDVLNIVDRLISEELLTTSPSLQFFEAVSMLTLYRPLRLSQKQDLWLLSGFALQHRTLSSTKGWFNGFAGSSATLTYLDIVPARTWNHLCHGHLVMCMGYRRHAMLDENTFDDCRNILTNTKANEFDGNILGMLSVYSMLYRMLRSPTLDLDYAIFQLEEWRKEWCHLWEQPEPQYSRIAYFYSYNVVYEASIQTATDGNDFANIPRYVSMVQSYALKTIDAIFELSAYDMSRCSDHVLFHAGFASASLLRLIYAAKTKEVDTSIVQPKVLNDLVTKIWKWLLVISVDQYHLATKFANYLKEYQKTVNEGTAESTWFKGPLRPVSSTTLQALKPYNLGVATVERG